MDEKTQQPEEEQIDPLDLIEEVLEEEPEAPAGEGGEAGEEQAGAQPEQAEAAAAPEPVEELPGEKILELFSKSEEAQRIARDTLAQYFAAAQRQAEALQQEAEFNKLVEEGNWEEIGRRFVQERTLETLRQQALTEAQQSAYVEVYRTLFAQPELQNLSETERARLAPRNFADDASYIAALTQFVAEKRAASKIEAEVEKRVTERLEALKNAQAASKFGAPSPAAIPSASGPSGVPSPEDLIKLGWQEILGGV